MKEIFEYVKARYIAPHMSEKGQGIVEYALILAFVVVVAAALYNSGALKTGVENTFSSVASKLSS